MGLFDGNAKKEAIEDEVLRALLKQPILGDLVYTVMNLEEKEPWLTKCQGYYDDRKRKVVIAKDLFCIEWSETRTEGEKSVKHVNGEVSYSYTASGYVPLHNHTNEKGKVDVTVGRVIALWATAVRSRLRDKLPQCRFSEITEYDDHATFTYTVPQLSFKEWF